MVKSEVICTMKIEEHVEEENKWRFGISKQYEFLVQVPDQNFETSFFSAKSSKRFFLDINSFLFLPTQTSMTESDHFFPVAKY